MISRRRRLSRIAVITVKVTATGALLVPILYLVMLMNPPPQTQAMALADLDGDGDPDAFLANGGGEDLQPNTVLWNEGNGRFRDSGQRLGHGGSVAVFLQDMNGDGAVDAVVSNGGWFDTFWNDGEGTFSEPESGVYPRIDGMFTGMWRTQMADLNGDGRDDMFVAGCCGGGQPPDYAVNPYNTVWLTEGEQLEKGTAQKFGRGSTHAVALADLDGDGDLDAFGANSFYRDDGFDTVPDANSVWLNDGDGAFANSGQRLGDLASYAVAAGDLDGDGDGDVFVGNNGPDEIWWNDGQGNFANSGQALGDSYTTVVHLADLDGDGDLDAFTAHDCDRRGLWNLLLRNACQGHIWLNNGGGFFEDSGQTIRYTTFHAVSLGDANGDGTIDIVAARIDKARVWLNDGMGNMELQ